MTSVYQISSPDDTLTGRVDLQGGKLSALEFTDSNEEGHAVFYQAHWLDTFSQIEHLPPLLQSLSGEWVCVPFGCVEKSDALFSKDAPHGTPANERWQCLHHDHHSIQLSYVYAADFPLRQLSRSIHLDNNGVARFSLTIESRKACRFPVGLHPVFPVGEEAGQVIIDTHGHDRGITYPKAPEPNVSRLMPGQVFNQLSQVATLASSTCDISTLPLPFATEEIVQLIEPLEGITLRYPQRQLRVDLTWDTTLLPHCLLWISNGGRQRFPWDGKNFCLGVEPLCSAWDLGPGSMKPSLLQATGDDTFLTLGAGESLTLSYQLRCSTDE